MIDRNVASQFAQSWLQSWNRRDLEALLSLYSDDVERLSPLVAQNAGIASGTIRGKAALRSYWRKIMERFPEQHFELVSILFGTESIVLWYKGARGMMTAEVFHFDNANLVIKADAHYTL